MPFPEEAVGVGARWMGSTIVDSEQVELSQTTIYELLELTDNGGKMKVSVTQTAPPQVLPAPAELPDAIINLTRLRSESTGEIAFDLSRVAPLMEMVFHMSLETNTEAMGMVLDTQVDTHMDIRIEGVE